MRECLTLNSTESAGTDNKKMSCKDGVTYTLNVAKEEFQ